MIWKLNFEFLDVNNMSTNFHENLWRLDAKTSMLVMKAKWWISWAKLKIWPKIFYSEWWMWKWSWACQITKGHVFIQNQVKFMSLYWKVECKWGRVCRSYWECNEESWKYDGMFFQMKWRMVELMKGEVQETLKCSSLQNFGLGNKCFLKMILDPLWPKKLCLCSLTQAPLPLSKSKRCKWESRGLNLGFIYIHVGDW